MLSISVSKFGTVRPRVQIPGPRPIFCTQNQRFSRVGSSARWLRSADRNSHLVQRRPHSVPHLWIFAQDCEALVQNPAHHQDPRISHLSASADLGNVSTCQIM